VGYHALNLNPGSSNSEGMCWVCGEINSLHSHHIIPRSCGGEYGPRVTLCAVHHNLVHNNEDTTDTKIMYLREFIQNAKSLSSPKTLAFSTKFNPGQATKLRRLAKFLLLSQEKVINLALDDLFNKHFK
jgi:5-methylcytosine-specific restriction endonuclease McrA